MENEDLPPLEKAKRELESRDPTKVKGAVTSELTDMQRKFCNYYVQGYSGKASAIKAGYSENGAAQQASYLLTITNISNEIRRLKDTLLSMIEMDTREILVNQVINATSDILDHVDIDENGRPEINLAKSPGKTRAIEAIEITELPAMTIVENGVEYAREVVKIKLKLWNKNQSAEFMGKHLGLLSPSPGSGDDDQSDAKANAMSVMDVCKRIAFLFAQAEQQRKHREATAITVEPTKEGET